MSANRGKACLRPASAHTRLRHDSSFRAHESRFDEAAAVAVAAGTLCCAVLGRACVTAGGVVRGECCTLCGCCATLVRDEDCSDSAPAAAAADGDDAATVAALANCVAMDMRCTFVASTLSSARLLSACADDTAVCAGPTAPSDPIAAVPTSVLSPGKWKSST